MSKPYAPVKSEEDVEKVLYNQAQSITQTLSLLRNSYVSSMMDKDYSGALRVSCVVVDLISAKLTPREIEDVDEMIEEIKKALPKALKTYVSDSGGGRFYKNAGEYDDLCIAVGDLWRSVEQLQDKHGYGMKGEEEYGLG